jgi:hypothetical protein
MNLIIQAIVYTVLILSFGCMAFGYWPQIIPGLLWLYLTFARERAERRASRLLGRWREYRHGGKCYQCGRATAWWVGTGWLPLCADHYREWRQLRAEIYGNEFGDENLP